MKIRVFLLAFSALMAVQVFAQTARNCGAMDLPELQLQQDPEMANRMEAIERHTIFQKL